MCGRFVQFSSWSHLQGTLALLTGPPMTPNYNVAPTHQIAVARERDGEREAVAMRWGLIPSWAKDAKAPLINARADTVATKPAFRAAFKRRRCVILADGYYEWKTAGKAKHPYLFRLKSELPFLMAGLWETWEGDDKPIESCTIITTDANASAAAVHNRMPVILTGNDIDAWLSAKSEPDALGDLLVPFTEPMACSAVSNLVNSVKNNSPACIEPIDGASGELRLAYE